MRDASDGESARDGCWRRSIVIVATESIKERNDGGVIFGQQVHLAQQWVERWQGTGITAINGLADLIHQAIIKKHDLV